MPRTKKPQSQIDMKLHNRRLIFNLIYRNRNISRIDISKITKMSPTTITRIVSELMQMNLVVEKESVSIGVGRKAVILDVNKDAFYILGIAIDFKKIMLCLIDLSGDIVLGKRFTYEEEYVSVEFIADKIHEAYTSMIDKSKYEKDKIKMAGVSIVGTVEYTNGNLIFSPQMHWQNINLKEIIEKNIMMPTIVENDVKSAIYEEYYRYEEHQVESLAYINIGSGVGSAFMQGGEILRGNKNAFGEIGHITVNYEGELCHCGRKGCLSAYLTDNLVVKKAKKYDESVQSINDIFQKEKEGIEWAVNLTNEIIEYTAIAINSILCSYSPKTIIIGGSIVNACEDIVKKISNKTNYHKMLYSEATITISKTQGYESVIGAALIAEAKHIENILNEKFI